jgi:4-hydroxy-tetrahydrodipicolinate reductase
MLRILQVGLGPLGRAVVRDLHERRLGHVVAAVDVDPELAGRSLATLLPECAERVHIEAGLDDVDPGLEVDAAVVTTSSWLTNCAPTFRALLERGLAVVSTCEELIHPWHRHAELAGELDALARAHGGRLLGTGVNPGFLMDALPVFATSVCREVRCVRVDRVQDASLRRLPFQKKVGVGLEREEFAAAAATGRFGHAGLEESLRFVADRLDLEVDAVEQTIEPLLAEEQLDSGLGPIAPGIVRGLRQVATGRAGGELRVELTFVAAVGEPDPHDAVRIDGSPELSLRIPGGVHGDVATTAIVLNAIRSLRAAPPGLHTMASVPLVGWRAARPGAGT